MIIERINNRPYFIMMVGLAGSGKSTIAENIQIKNGDNMRAPVVHSSDALRLEIFGDETDQEHHNEIFAELHKRIKDDLRSDKDVVYDATNLSKKRRSAFVRELSNISCKKACICVMTPYETCLKSNENRDRTIPENAIRNMYMNWTPPHVSEGFDVVIPVFNYDAESERKYDIDELIDRIGKIDQENKHHSLTIGDHCVEAAEYIRINDPHNRNLKIAALLHDIGKEFTKTHINGRGENDGQAHYYQHQNVGAYDAMFYLDKVGLKPDDQLYISNIIYYHMHPYMSWEQSSKAMNRDKKMIGDKMFGDISMLHEADVHAHIPMRAIEHRLDSLNEITHEEGDLEIGR